MQEGGYAALVHIGYPKAASSAIQEFLGKHGQLHYVAGPSRQACRRLLIEGRLTYDKAAAVEVFSNEGNAATRAGKVLTLSHERLSGNAHSGHYDALDIADRLRGLLPMARILIVIREQITMISSIYKQYVRIGGVRSFAHYSMPGRDGRIPFFNWRSYEYDLLIDYYRSLFGKSQVHILLFEDLQRDPEGFFRSIADIAGVDFPKGFDPRRVVNPGIPDRLVEYQRRLNFFTPTVPSSSVRDPNPLQTPALRWLASVALRLCPGNGRYSEKSLLLQEVAALVGNRYRPSNLRLSRLLGRDLASLGYDLEPPAGSKTGVVPGPGGGATGQTAPAPTKKNGRC